jgi:TetR/AcrR family transcriptional regulator
MVDKTEPQARREAILGAARREFATAGWSGARIERIAAAARVNKQLLFHYFESKEGLLGAAVASLLADERPADAAESPVERLRLALTALSKVLRSTPGLAALVAEATANPRFPPQAATLLRAWRERSRDRIASVLEDGQRRGYFRDDIEPVAVAEIAVAAVLGMRPQHLNDDSASGPAYLATLVADHCAWK